MFANNDEEYTTPMLSVATYAHILICDINENDITVC